MIKWITNTTAILLSMYFLLAGLGFNIIHYCCDECAVEGIEYVAQHSCESIHHHEQDACCSHQPAHEHTGLICNDLQHINEGCHIVRLNVETPVFQSDSQITFNTPEWIQTLLVCQALVADFQFVETYAFNLPPPPDFSYGLYNREILALNSVLLI